VDNRVNNFCGKGCEYPCWSPGKGGLGCTLAPWERRAAEPERGRDAGIGMVDDLPADVRRAPTPRPFRRPGPRGFLAFWRSSATSWAYSSDGSSRRVWGRGTRRHNFLRGGPQRPPAGGRWVGRRSAGVAGMTEELLWCGGGAVHLRFGVVELRFGVPGRRQSAWRNRSAWRRRTGCGPLRTTARGSFGCFDQCWLGWRWAGGKGAPGWWEVKGTCRSREWVLAANGTWMHGVGFEHPGASCPGEHSP
jgi:hypothetical protein